jgi:hypothetical protein
MSAQRHPNEEQFFHGTTAKFEPGDYLTPKGANEHGRYEEEGGRSHVYITPDIDRAETYAHARAGSPHWRWDSYDEGPKVYQVQPMGKIEPDPGDEYASARTRARVKVIRRLGSEELGQ